MSRRIILHTVECEDNEKPTLSLQLPCKRPSNMPNPARWLGRRAALVC